MHSPSLDDSDNYISDSHAFRKTVARSFLVSYGFAFASLLMVLFLPTQARPAQPL